MNVEGANLTGILSAIIDAINSKKTFDGPMPLAIGLTEIEKFRSPPSVVFVPLYDDNYRGPHDQPDDAQAYLETTTFVEVHCWGSNFAEAERVRNAFLIAAHVIYSPNAFLTKQKGTWSKDSKGDRGVELVLTAGFVVPILYTEFAVASIKSVENETVVVVDNIYDVNNPAPVPPPGPVDALGGLNPEPLPP